MIHYPAAYSEDRLVEITSVTEKDRRKEYFCISCGAEMHPVLGSKKEHYFRHSGVSCSWDGFIHKYAEEKFKEAFDNSDTFLIPFNRHNKCPKVDNCLLYNQFAFSKCDGIIESLDLKKWYDTCEVEKECWAGDKKYIADLLLTNSKNEGQKPLFIEIFHTHKCTDDKRNSGIKIIEIKIDTIDNIKTFLDPKRQKFTSCELINFKPESHITGLYDVQKASYTKDVQDELKCEKIQCVCTDERLANRTEDSLFEVLVPANEESSLKTLKNIGRLIGIQKGLIKECRYCQHYATERVFLSDVPRCRVDFFLRSLPEKPCEKFVLYERALESTFNKVKSNAVVFPKDLF